MSYTIPVTRKTIRGLLHPELADATTVPVPFTDARKETFLMRYATIGLKEHSALHAGVCWQTVKNHMAVDKPFAMAVELAYNIFCDTLEGELVRRGYAGVLEPVWIKGQQALVAVVDAKTGTVKVDDDGLPVFKPAFQRNYSDRLLELAVKRHIPGFRDHVTTDVNVQAGVLLVPAAPAGEDATKAWVDQYAGATTAKLDDEAIDVTNSETPTITPRAAAAARRHRAGGKKVNSKPKRKNREKRS